MLYIIIPILIIVLCIIKIIKDDKATKERNQEIAQRKKDQSLYEEIKRNNLEKANSPVSRTPIKIETKAETDTFTPTYTKCNTLKTDYVVLDLETTGLDPRKNEIIEIGAIKFLNNEKMDSFHEYVNIHKPIPANITKLTGITDSDLSDAPELSDVLSRFHSFISDIVLVIHNASFDMRFLQINYHNILGITLSNQVIDTLSLSKKYLSNLDNHKLTTIKEYFNVDVGSHNALDDCETTSVLYKYCYNQEREKKLQEELKTSSFDKEIMEVVCNIVRRNDLSDEIQSIKLNVSSTYTDVVYLGYQLLRFKTKGKLRYWLIDYKLEEFSKKYATDLTFTEGSKSEKDRTRLFINSADDIYPFANIVLEKISETQKSYENYLRYKSSGSDGLSVTVSIGYDENGEVKVSSSRK
ncbi:MAG: 3'-5' exoribonuclease [Ruminococcus sp.]|nr:3'-5' exoribonuclease [Ruminococcus sp.]